MVCKVIMLLTSTLWGQVGFKLIYKIDPSVALYIWYCEDPTPPYPPNNVLRTFLFSLNMTGFHDPGDQAGLGF